MTAVVTGASGGIGAAIAHELAGLGHRVVVTSRRAEAAEAVAASIRDAGGRAQSASLDVTDRAAVDALAAEIDAIDDGITVWVNNAGVSKMQPFLSVSEGDLTQTMHVNLYGTFFGGQAAGKVMRARGTRGVIVNVASMAGQTGAVPFLSDYVASKYAVVGLTQSMATELGPLGIRVNAVCPGYVATPMQDREVSWEAALTAQTEAEVRDGYVAATPLGRLSTPEDTAKAVGFLTSDAAEFITGIALPVNGGALMG
ncbi:SDR family oxidoreductase [Leucobacter sp. gxy201]|uniref:SDR family NAD(P)-dependent oxidoreductase n=1 Tax=Leucobacter sp. gxy201 TaxID=2957200 RepID=UPI003DA18A20